LLIHHFPLAQVTRRLDSVAEFAATELKARQQRHEAKLRWRDEDQAKQRKLRNESEAARLNAMKKTSEAYQELRQVRASPAGISLFCKVMRPLMSLCIHCSRLQTKYKAQRTHCRDHTKKQLILYADN